MWMNNKKSARLLFRGGCLIDDVVACIQ